jgi:hypothetical protein
VVGEHFEALQWLSMQEIFLMAEVPAVVDEKAEGKRRGHYQVSARLAKVLTLLASGEAKTQVEACEAAGMTPRALQLAMKKPSVRAYLQQVVMTSLGLSAAKAAKRMDELLHSSNEMVSFNASRFALGAGAVLNACGKAAVSVVSGVAHILAAGAGTVLRIQRLGFCTVSDKRG